MIENNLQETYKKFDIFLEKLKKRAEEIAIDGQETVQEIYDSDDDLYKRDFIYFQKWLEWKFTEIISKAENVYKTKIIPEEQNFWIWLWEFQNIAMKWMQKTDKINEMLAHKEAKYKEYYLKLSRENNESVTDDIQF